MDRIMSGTRTVKSRHEYIVALNSVKNSKKSVRAGKKHHFIGCGGVGMSGLATLLLKENAIVSGSDIAKTAVTDRLIASGADIKEGHQSDNLPDDAEAVVISAAVEADNPELVKAKDSGIMVYKYAQMLGLLMDGYDGLAIAGTHGKSTTGGWLVHTLVQLGLDPNYIIGADITQLDKSSASGSGNAFIAEACEYDRSFLNLHPKTGVILNIEADHLDYYTDENQIVEAFTDFANGIRSDGVLLAGTEDKNVAKVVASLQGKKEVITFGIGIEGRFDWAAVNVKLEKDFTSFDVHYNGEFIAAAKIQLPGIHNVRNALAVVASAVAAGAEAKTVIEKLGEFTGMDRRMEEKGRVDGIVIVDDYAHHPTEIKASLEAVRQKYAPQRLICVFQPHQYSRTRFLLKDFSQSFVLADLTIVPEIYFVRDTAESKSLVDAEKLVAEIQKCGSEAIFVDSFERICEYLKSNVKSGDVVITMGAGDIWKVADEYIRWFKGNS